MSDYFFLPFLKFYTNLNIICVLCRKKKNPLCVSKGFTASETQASVNNFLQFFFFFSFLIITYHFTGKNNEK